MATDSLAAERKSSAAEAAFTHRNAAHNPEGAAPVGCNCLVGPAWTKFDSCPPFRPPGLDLWVTTDPAGYQRVPDYWEALLF